MSKPQGRVEEENFAIELSDSCQSHGAWLSVMRFGLGTLLENQPLLMELMVREAQKQEKVKDTSTNVHASDYVRVYLKELGLRLVPALWDGKDDL